MHWSFWGLGQALATTVQAFCGRAVGKGGVASARAYMALGALLAGTALSLLAALTQPMPDATIWVWLLAAIPVEILVQHLISRSFDLEDLSLTSPLFALSPVAVALAAIPLLHEAPTPMGWAGIGLVAVGIWWLNADRGALAPLRGLWRSVGVRYAFAAALLVGVAVSIHATGMKAAGPSWLWWIGPAFLGAGLALAAMSAEEIGRAWSQPWSRLGPGLLLPTLAGGLATTLEPWFFWNGLEAGGLAAYLTALRRLSIPLAVLFAILLHRERTDARRRLIGSLVVTAGVVLLVTKG